MSDVSRTPTQTLLEVMEDFGVSEPKECIVIYTNEAGDFAWSSSTDSLVIKLGLVEAAKQFIASKLKMREG